MCGLWGLHIAIDVGARQLQFAVYRGDGTRFDVSAFFRNWLQHKALALSCFVRQSCWHIICECHPSKVFVEAGKGAERRPNRALTNLDNADSDCFAIT